MCLSPGGADALTEVAGTDATSAYEDVGHSEDAREVMHAYLVGVVKDAVTAESGPQKQTVHAVRRGPSKEQPKRSNIASPRTELAAFALGTLLVFWYSRTSRYTHESAGKAAGGSSAVTGFTQGFLWATTACAAVGAMGYRYLSKAISPGGGFTSYPAHIPSSHVVRSINHPAGFLVRTDYQRFRLVKKDELAKDIYRFVFALPGKSSVLGLPIGQHIAIRGYWDDESGHHTVVRSYTPVSNNSDFGRLELVIRCYPDGQLTGKYLANLDIGAQVEFRGPTGVMKYRKGLCKRIGMVAGGTGVTPMCDGRIRYRSLRVR